MENKTVFGVIGAVIKAFALMLIDLFNMGSEGIAIADKAVKVAREHQAIDLDIAETQYKRLAILKAASMQQQATDEVLAYIAKDSTGERGKAIDARVKELEAVVAKSMAEVAVHRASRKV